jgi:hypothetical protein
MGFMASGRCQQTYAKEDAALARPANADWPLHENGPIAERGLFVAFIFSTKAERDRGCEGSLIRENNLRSLFHQVDLLRTEIEAAGVGCATFPVNTLICMGLSCSPLAVNLPVCVMILNKATRLCTRKPMLKIEYIKHIVSVLLGTSFTSPFQFASGR